MARYYYYASTLPRLTLDSPLPYTVEAFMLRAQEMVSKRDYNLLEDALHARATDNAFLITWGDFQRMLSAELARQRSKRVDFTYDTSDLVEEVPAYLAEAVYAAMRTEDPLEAELQLLQLEWKALEEFLGFATFSIEAICAHLLQLQLKERRTRFDAEAGNTEFARLFTDLQAEIAQR